eukprot:11526704-Ditylum_brightwellii.AAC.1
MGWLQSAAFFCEATGMAKIIMDDLVQQNIPLLLTPLEKFFAPEEEVKLALTTASLRDVYTDDFILAGQPANQEDLKKWARAAIWAILCIFPPTSHTGH